jgi:hypothetical protein
MPLIANSRHFNIICELNYKADPVKSMTCGQFIKACQQDAERKFRARCEYDEGFGLLRDTHRHTSERDLRRANTMRTHDTSFDGAINRLSRPTIRPMAMMCIESVRASVSDSCIRMNS